MTHNPDWSHLHGLINRDGLLEFSTTEIGHPAYEELSCLILVAQDRYANAFVSFASGINRLWTRDKSGLFREHFYNDDTRTKLRTLVCAIIYMEDYLKGKVWSNDIESVAHSLRLFHEYNIVEKFRPYTNRKFIRWGEYEIEF